MARNTDEASLQDMEAISDQRSRVAPIPRPGYAGKYPQWIGHKFEPDGSVRRFPGHGVMCFLPRENPLYHALQAFQEDLPKQTFATSLTMLPPSVWHMTVYEGVSDQIRNRNGWPAELDLDCSLEECHEFVARKLIDFDLGFEPRFRLTPVGWEPIEDGVALKVAGATPEDEEKLRDLRNRLAEVLQLRHPGFNQYSFHIGLAYQLRFQGQDANEELARYLQSRLQKLPKEFELGVSTFCTYDDMLNLDRKFDLRQRTNCK